MRRRLFEDTHEQFRASFKAFVAKEMVPYNDEWEQAGMARVLRYDAPFNFAALHNFAVPQCAGELICLLNNDTEIITPGWLREMAGHALRPSVGAVGEVLFDDVVALRAVQTVRGGEGDGSVGVA